MRFEKGRRAASRQQIVDAASRRFRADGVAASGVAAVMADAGLTNGAFYGHFESKEALVQEVVVQALDGQAAALGDVEDTTLSLETVVRAYLSGQHRDDPGSGCVSAALLSEIGRHPPATREAYTDRLVGVIDKVACLLPPGLDPAAARRKALSIFGLLAGSLQLARAVCDPALSDQILEDGVQGALALSRG